MSPINLKDTYWRVPIRPSFRGYLGFRIRSRKFSVSGAPFWSQHCAEGLHQPYETDSEGTTDPRSRDHGLSASLYSIFTSNISNLRLQKPYEPIKGSLDKALSLALSERFSDFSFINITNGFTSLFYYPLPLVRWLENSTLFLEETAVLYFLVRESPCFPKSKFLGVH